MSEAFDKELIGLEDANKVLDEMIAAEQSADESHAAAAAAVKDQQDHGEGDTQNSDEASGDAAKAADAAEGKAGEPAKANDEAQKSDDEKSKAEGQKAEAGKQESRYAQARTRLEGGWKELNAGKATLQAERDAWKKQQEAERLALETERAEFEQQRSQAEQQFTPEAYDKAAAKFEREGNFDLADMAKAKAEELRRNPPQKPADRLAAQRKEWSMKAGLEFPEIMKDNSPLQVAVAQILKAEPDLERHPKGIYLAARLATLEAKAKGAVDLQTRLDAQTKALTEAQAKIKQLEGEMSPGDGTNNNRLPKAKRFEQMSDAEQFAELERQAREVGVLTR